jgi:hypothetical protein
MRNLLKEREGLLELMKERGIEQPIESQRFESTLEGSKTFRSQGDKASNNFDRFSNALSKIARVVSSSDEERAKVAQGITGSEYVSIAPDQEYVDNTRNRLPIYTNIAATPKETLKLTSIPGTESLNPHIGPGPQIAVQVQSEVLADILPLLAAPRIDRVALVQAMADKAKGINEIREVLFAIESLPLEQQRDLEMSIRTAVALKGLGDLAPANLNVVVQVAPIEQANAANTFTRQIEDKLMRRFNGVSTKSIIGRGIDDNDVDGLAALIAQAKKTMDADKNPQQARALLLLPALTQNLANRQKIVNVAMEKAGAMQNGVADPRFRIQFVEQGNMPDTVTQFELGVEILEHTRSLEKDAKAEPSQRLLNLIAAMVEGAVDPRTIINELFKGILKIRKIDWRTVDEQRKSWEAVATAL